MCTVCIACGITTMFGGCNASQRAREISVAAFAFAVHYAFLPAAMVFAIICAIGANTWSVKGLSFMVTGSLSVHGLPLPGALLASGVEVVFGIVLTCIEGGFVGLYTRYANKDRARRRWPDPDESDLQFDFDSHEMEEAPIDL